ncbi:MAG: Clp protease N-terminal domain-containing protein, partial [Ilumatobacteraceae bacterium]
MALDPKKWTTKTQEAVAEAGDLARSLANPQLTADHLLFAIASQEGTVAAALLS